MLTPRMHKNCKNQSVSAVRSSKSFGRKALEEKVEAGTLRAVKEYGEVFRRLAEYDRT